MFAAVLLMTTGCKKISTNKLQGLWSTEPHWDDSWNCNIRKNVYDFINSNTVCEYYYVADNTTHLDESGYEYESFPGKPGWYNPNGKTMLTYVFEDNKVILTDGTIFTYMDGKLFKDGSSTILYPW